MRTLTVVAFVFMASAAFAEPRVALVVGNSGYDAKMGPLANPANDAQVVAAALTKAGFNVDLQTNLDQRSMKLAIKRLGERLTAAGPQATGLFYYAGHGLQVSGENYLVPLGTDIQSEADADIDAVATSGILAQMENAGNPVNIVILDACRNTPVLRKFRSGTRGLARIDAPKGSYVVYSTAPGAVAEDGTGANSAFAAAFADLVATTHEPIDDLFIDVRKRVLTATNQKQTPWTSSSLADKFYFLAPVTGSAPIFDAKAAEVEFWKSVEGSGDTAQLQSYLDRYPTGIYAALARAKIASVKAPLTSAPAASAAAIAPPSEFGPLRLIDTQRLKLNDAFFVGNGHYIAATWSTLAKGDAPNNIRIYDAENGNFVRSLQLDSARVGDAVSSPDGNRIVIAGSDGQTYVWNLQTGKLEMTLGEKSLWVDTANFSSDGRRIAAVKISEIEIWNMSSQQQIAKVTHLSRINSVQFSPDSRSFVTAHDDGTARVWTAVNGAEILQLRGHKKTVNTAVYSTDGRYILTTAEDGTARVWDAQTGEMRKVLKTGGSGSVRAALFSPDGKRIYVQSSISKQLWDAQTGQRVADLGFGIGKKEAAFSPDSRLLATVDLDNIRIWDAQTGKQLAQKQGEGTMWSVDFSHDGKRIVAASDDGNLYVWDLTPQNVAARH